jgi:exodeoxyribonuclease VII small subunit
MNYKEAKTELDAIIEDIESGYVDIDSLSAKIKRAGELIQFCKNKLRETEESIDNILLQFEKEQQTATKEDEE